MPLWNPLHFILRACAVALLCTALYLLVRGVVFIYDLYAFLEWLEGLGG